jgi:hypothetical protein
MKNFVYSLIGAIVIFATLTVFPSAIPDFRTPKEVKSKPSSNSKQSVPSDQYLRGLVEAGFVNIPGITEAVAVERRKHYKEKYDLNFLSTSELSNLVTENHLIIGPAENYIGTIPSDVMIQISINYDKFKKTDLNKGISYVAPDNRVWTKAQVDEMSNLDRMYVLSGNKKGTVLVAAPQSQFNTAGYIIIDNQMVKPPPKDPLALIEVEGGYIELGRWLN